MDEIFPDFYCLDSRAIAWIPELLFLQKGYCFLLCGYCSANDRQ